ncbi:PcfJ-like protein, partial [Bacteroides ovatus]
IAPMCTYPRQRFIPELKRNGFNGDYHNTLPYDLFTAILSDSRAETLLKAGQYAMLRHYIRSSFDMGRYWASVKICIRNGYTISDGSVWCDTIDLLRHFGKDTNSPKYVCPADLKAEHDKLVRKRNLQRERERTEQQRQKAIEDEKNYLKAKGIFFGLVFSDSLICIKVIESVEEMVEEGRMMHHCVGGYHNKANSLILSATIDGKRIETIEVSLKTLKVVQSRGVCNSNTEYHDRIIRLVEDNTELIRQRMNAA